MADTIFKRIARAFYPKRFNLKNPTDWQYLLEASKAKSGVTVTEESALKFSAVFACVNYISSTISTLPFRPYVKTSEGKYVDEDHDQFPLLKFGMSKYASSVEFFRDLISFYLLYGNGYAEIIRNERGRPIEYMLLHPSMVEPYKDKETEDIYYKYHSEVNKGVRDIHYSNMIHLRDYTYGDLKGRSRIMQAKESVGVGIASTDFSASFYGQGTQLGGWVEWPTELTKEQVDRLRSSFKAQYGGIENVGSVAVLEMGAKFHNLSMPLRDAQFIETSKFSVENIARMYQIPPTKIGVLDNATYSNIEEQNKEVIQDCIRPIVVLIEKELDRKIYRERERLTHYTKADLKSLLRSNIKDRTEHYTSMLNYGVYSINEIRALEDLNPIEGGDMRFQPLNMGKLGEEQPENNNSNGRTYQYKYPYEG